MAAATHVYWNTGPKWHPTLLKFKKQSEGFEDVVISLLGGMRTGKSTLINALLGAPVLPTGGEEACTSAVTEVSYAEGPEYTARIEFMSRLEWEKLVEALLAEDRAEAADEQAGGDREGNARAEGHAILREIYGSERLRAIRETKNLTMPTEIEQALAAGSATIQENDLGTFMDRIAPYIVSENPAKTKGNNAQPVYWPIVRVVKISAPFPSLRSGIRLVDLPGISDPNPARRAITQNHLKNCRFLWFVFNMKGVLDNGLSEVITSEQYLQMVLDGRATATTFIGTGSDDFKLAEARKKFDKPHGTKSELAQERNNHVRKQVHHQLHDLFQQTFGAAPPALRERQHALEQSFSEARIFTVSAWDYLVRKHPELDPEEKPTLEETETTIPALLDYMQDQCKEFGIYAQERQLHRQIGSHLRAIQQEVRAQLIALEPRAQTDDQQEALKQATACVCESLRKDLENLTNAYRRDLEQSCLVLAGQLKDGIDQAEDDLVVILARWNAYAANQIQAVVRAGTEGRVFYSRTLRRDIDFVDDLTKPILKAVAFAWDDFFGTQLDAILNKHGRQLLKVADGRFQELVTAVRNIVSADAALQDDLKRLFQTTQQLLADYIEQATVQMTQKIESRRRSLHEELPSCVREKMQPGFAKAALQEGGHGVQQRMLRILKNCARSVSKDMHDHVEQTIVKGIKELCNWLLAQFKGMTETVGSQLEKTAAGLRPAVAGELAADVVHQIDCLKQIDGLIDGLVRQEENR